MAKLTEQRHFELGTARKKTRMNSDQLAFSELLVKKKKCKTN